MGHLNPHFPLEKGAVETVQKGAHLLGHSLQESALLKALLEAACNGEEITESQYKTLSASSYEGYKKIAESISHAKRDYQKIIEGLSALIVDLPKVPLGIRWVLLSLAWIKLGNPLPKLNSEEAEKLIQLEGERKKICLFLSSLLSKELYYFDGEIVGKCGENETQIIYKNKEGIQLIVEKHSLIKCLKIWNE